MRSAWQARARNWVRSVSAPGPPGRVHSNAARLRLITQPCCGRLHFPPRRARRPQASPRSPLQTSGCNPRCSSAEESAGDSPAALSWCGPYAGTNPPARRARRMPRSLATAARAVWMTFPPARLSMPARAEPAAWTRPGRSPPPCHQAASSGRWKLIFVPPQAIAGAEGGLESSVGLS